MKPEILLVRLNESFILVDGHVQLTEQFAAAESVVVEVSEEGDALAYRLGQRVMIHKDGQRLPLRGFYLA